MKRCLIAAAVAVSTLAAASHVRAEFVYFFSPTQTASLVGSGVTSDTLSSSGYLFNMTRDKLFTGGIGTDPIGRSIRVPWPNGVEAQSVTTPPPGGMTSKAQITLSRVDGDVFALNAFTAKLLANTGGAGADIEIMPSLNGEDGFNDPLYFNASGYYGQSFSYDTSPNYWGSTALLTGFDKYTITLYVDFAFTALALDGAYVPLSGDFDDDGRVDGLDFLAWQRGESPGGALASDLADWKANFGVSFVTLPVASAVPEPATGGLLLLAVLAGLVRKSANPLNGSISLVLSKYSNR